MVVGELRIQKLLRSQQIRPANLAEVAMAVAHIPAAASTMSGQESAQMHT